MENAKNPQMDIKKWMKEKVANIKVVLCETGFYTDNDDWKYIGYDGTKDTSLSNFNKIQPVILMLIVALLIYY